MCRTYEALYHCGRSAKRFQFNYETLRYKDIEEHVPDVTQQAGKVANLTLARIKDDFGLDPFYISCHFCFAKQIPEDDLRAVLKLPYASLYEPIGKWIASLLVAGPVLASHPPNLHSLLKAVIMKTKTIAIADGEPGLEEEADASNARKEGRKARKTAKGAARSSSKVAVD